MLVLSRKRGEKLYIGEAPDEICVTLVDIQNGKVRLGIEARRDIPIWREEMRPKVGKEAKVE